MERHALLLELLVREPGDLLVLDRQDSRERLDDGDRRAQVVVEAGELDADRAGADHEEPRRQLRRHHRLLVAPDEFAVGLEARERAGARAGREDHARGAELRGRAVGTLDRDSSRPGESAVPVVDGDLVLFEQTLHAGVQPLRHLSGALHDLLDVDGHVADRQAEVASVLDQVVDLAGAQQGLRRDAAPVEADPAEVLTLDERDREAELPRPDRSRIPARPSADHHYVVLRLAHACSSLSTVRCALGGVPRRVGVRLSA